MGTVKRKRTAAGTGGNGDNSTSFKQRPELPEKSGIGAGHFDYCFLSRITPKYGPPMEAKFRKEDVRERRVEICLRRV